MCGSRGGRGSRPPPPPKFACADLEGAGGLDPPPPTHTHTHTLKNKKNKVFFSNSGQDPLKNKKFTKPTFNVGPSIRHLNDRLWPVYSSI